ncbi:MAG: tRNA lysidine(34) synthetase TilS [Campylobacterota bacterium]|nr:tRNA lysidine(34) synthetase TilS [Campylobacterota bacterium]
MLKKESIRKLKTKKNLLAFSAGVDSSALFFLLLQQQIPFDIAIIDYNKRSQSKKEVAYAKELSNKYNKALHVKSVYLSDSNFEYNARQERYNFFEELIAKHNYENLITAHHLGDKLEWFLMQFCKGSGVDSLVGMREFEKRDGYAIVRPLLHVEKKELLEYLNSSNIKYFEDESNKDEKYERNYFRHNFSEKLLEKYSDGILKSFEFLEEDATKEPLHVERIKRLSYFKKASIKENIFTIDKELKRRGYLLSQSERVELKSSTCSVVGREFVVAIHNESMIIAPFVKTTMSKEFKDRCRVLRVEPKLRGYIFENRELLELFGTKFA